MSASQLLSSMCAELSDTDLNAIRKARGFSASESVSRTSFANFYITSVGLANVLEQLSLEENLTLRLLLETSEVDISFFERLYGAGNARGTYTQRYKPTFDTVKKNLVRRGLVVMAEVKTRGDTVQLQRWRFALPHEFAPFLHPLPTVQNSQAGQANESVIRKKLIQLIYPGQSSAPNNPLIFEKKQGDLYLNNQFFSTAALRDSQVAAWGSDLKTFKPNVPASLSPVEAALKLLSSENWTDPKVIEPALKIFCFGGSIPTADKLLRKGWELGLLSRLEIACITYYRLAPVPNGFTSNQVYPPALDWADTNSIPDSVKIDLQRIPFFDLEQLNMLTHLEIENGDLVASPILQRHTNENILVIGMYLDQLDEIAALLQAPLINGQTPVREREILYEQFRTGEIKILVVSKVANFSIDLPDASVAIEISGTFGSRQEEAQRLGRILRPKNDGLMAHFYTIVTRDTVDQTFAANRQRFLTEQGYKYEILYENEVL